VERLPASIHCPWQRWSFALVVAIPIGIISAVYRGSALVWGVCWPLSLASHAALLAGHHVHHDFSVKLGWLPTSGRGTPAHLIMPSLALALSLMAMFARLTRSVMLEVLSLDYIRTARAKGSGSFLSSASML